MNLLFHKLNARQREILKAKDLPTSWIKLQYNQKKAIVAIEEMLQYVEKKYNKKFCYNGYTAAMPLFGDDECLYTYAEGDDPETSTFSVERTEDGFTDGYAWVCQLPVVQAEVEERLGKIFEGESYKMFVELTGVDDDGRVKAVDVCTYIEKATEEKLDTIIEKIVTELNKEKDYIVDFIMYSYREGLIQGMTTKNHKDICDSDDIIVAYFSDEIDRRNAGCGWYKND